MFVCFFYQVVNTLSDCATAKATNAATRGRLVTASYCDFTIFAALAAVTARAMSAAAAPVATISRYGCCCCSQNLNDSQTLKPTSPWKLAGDENSSIQRSHTETISVSSVCVRRSATLPWRIVDYRLNVRATRAGMDRSLEFCSDGERRSQRCVRVSRPDPVFFLTKT